MGPPESSQKKIAIFIPARNVSRTLAGVLDRIPDDLKSRVKEIFVIDNDSKDNTYLIGVEYKREKMMKNLNIYKNDRNLGYGGNQKKAYAYAAEKEYDIVVMLHGDAQYSPEFIPLLLGPLESDGADFVFGSRMRDDPLGGGMPLWRYFGNRFLTSLENRVLGLKISEYHSGFRAFNISALKKLPFNLLSDDYHFDTEIIIQFALAGMRIEEVNIPTHYGKESGSPTLKQTLLYSLNILKDMCILFFHKKGVIRQKKFDVGVRG